MFTFKSLERRLIILLVAPLTLFLLGFGIYGYHFIHGILFKEWREVAILRLGRAAHQIDIPGQPNHRIQGQAQGGEVVVSEMVFHHLEDIVAVKRTFQTTLKGIAQPVPLYVVESMRGET